jgi:glycerol-3-phosphate dehydrogenase
MATDIDSGGGPVDLLVVGGGANGCAIARDAAGRGLSVTLCEAGDLAGATSSNSSKLIHGGLRYLEHYAFRLVRESLAEREVLLATAPHIIYPLRFVLPHHKGLRPAWFLRLGLFLYDHIGGRRTLPATRGVDLRRGFRGAPLKASYVKGFEYSDAWTDDARMVVLAAVDAAEHGARILTRTRLVSARRDGEHWRAVLRSRSGAEEVVVARALVNAAGPWVGVVAQLLGANTQGSVKLVKGSHIVVPKLYEGDHAYTLQGGDGRVIFAIPYESRFTLVGTTDVPLDGDPGPVRASKEEIDYLCGALGDYFEEPVTPDQVVWTYAGVRPLFDDGKANASAVTRDYVLDLETPEGAAPLLTIYGGKITTFRELGERALDLLKGPLGVRQMAWTRTAPLPGGDLKDGFEAFRNAMAAQRPWLMDPHLTRLCRAYGSRLETLLGDAAGWDDLGQDFGAGLTQREIDYLKGYEWAKSADDVLWRRTKLGLHMTPAQRAGVATAFASAEMTDA